MLSLILAPEKCQKSFSMAIRLDFEARKTLKKSKREKNFYHSIEIYEKVANLAYAAKSDICFYILVVTNLTLFVN